MSANIGFVAAEYNLCDRRKHVGSAADYQHGLQRLVGTSSTRGTCRTCGVVFALTRYGTPYLWS